LQTVVNSTGKDIVVKSKAKPMVEVKADRTILNVENTISAIGSDALTLLRKSPGVVVDRNDNLSLSGKNGVVVYIDGKPSPLSGADLAAYLKSLQANQIEAIEIIKNPSAKFDAAGNAGIINIRLKKNKTLGTNGSVNIGAAQGFYPKFNQGVNLNYRNKKTNWYGGFNASQEKNRSIFNLYRTILDTAFDQKNIMVDESRNFGYKTGVDFYVNKKSTFGIAVNGNVDNSRGESNSSTPITYMPTKFSLRTLVARNSSKQNNRNISFNGNYKYTDTSGKDLNVDVDYGIYKLSNDQLQPNDYFNTLTGLLLSNQTYNFIPKTTINLASVKLDYEQNFKGGKLGIGFKNSLVATNNGFKRYDVFNSNKKLDTLRSNDFDYAENINAVYANFNKQLKGGIFYQVGLRAEHTNSKGQSTGFKYTNQYIPFDSTFKRNYINLFPSAAISFNKNPKHQFTVSYSKRIDRPAYQDLNPFEFKLDEYTFQKGNTNLTPQYTNSVSVSHTYNYFLTTSIEYSHVNDVFTQLVDTIDISRSFISKRNLAKQDAVSLSISSPLQFGRYNGFINLGANYSKFKANFGTGRTVDVEAFQFNIYADNNYKINSTTTAQIGGWFAGPGIWEGTFKSISMGGVDVGLMKSLWNNKANIKLSVTDVAFTMKWGGESNFAGQYLNTTGNWESRQVKLNFTYRFGSNLIKAARQRSKGTEDEQKRIKKSGGGIGG
jgi:iron complex outermembrane recepter protein